MFNFSLDVAFQKADIVSLNQTHPTNQYEGDVLLLLDQNMPRWKIYRKKETE